MDPHAAKLPRLELVVCAAPADRAAWHDLYLRTRADLLGDIFRFLGAYGPQAEQEAEDILQHLWLRLIAETGEQALRLLTEHGVPPRTWLAGLARSIVVSHVRSGRTRGQREAEAARQAPLADVIDETSLWLSELLPVLPPVLHAWCVRELTDPLSGESLSAKERQRRHRLLRRVEEFLTDTESGAP